MFVVIHNSTTTCYDLNPNEWMEWGVWNGMGCPRNGMGCPRDKTDFPKYDLDNIFRNFSGRWTTTYHAFEFLIIDK